ncbi:MAG: hypothetical protein OSA51_04045 [Octadecabacter sp.]|nr:hypothetical protein [Octadecabacter sp.]
MRYSILTLILTVTFVISPYFTSPFSGFDVNQLPIPQIDPPIQPAGYAFAIWGLIYGWLIISAFFGIFKRSIDPAWDKMRAPLIISLALGTPWLWVANQSAVGATVLIFAMAFPAIVAMLHAPREDPWLALWPISIYAGWLTAASFVSLGSTAAGYGILFGANGWAIVGITLSLFVSLTLQIKKPTAPAYGMTIIWALVGIIAANGITAVAALSAIGIIAMLTLLAMQIRQHINETT